VVVVVVVVNIGEVLS